MKYGVQDVSISALIRKGWLSSQMRDHIHQDKVEQYAEAMTDGSRFPDPVVFADPKTELIAVGDGFHRILAHRRNGAKVVKVDLKRGSAEEAILHNVRANAEQRGLAFDAGDMRRAVTTLLQMPATKSWPQSKIAALIGCSSAMVSRLAKNLPDRTIIDSAGRERNGTLTNRVDQQEQGSRRAIVSALLSEGTTIKEIAQTLGVSESAIRHDRLALEHEGDLIECPHCKGSGYVSNLRSKGKK